MTSKVLSLNKIFDKFILENTELISDEGVYHLLKEWRSNSQIQQDLLYALENHEVRNISQENEKLNEFFKTFMEKFDISEELMTIIMNKWNTSENQFQIVNQSVSQLNWLITDFFEEIGTPKKIMKEIIDEWFDDENQENVENLLSDD